MSFRCDHVAGIVAETEVDLGGRTMPQDGPIPRYV